MTMYKLIKRDENIYFVDSLGSSAIVKDFFYINGKKASAGTYTYVTETGDITVEVDANGMVTSYG